MEAVIFDMDGLLIDSEPMWAQAEKKVFSSLGVRLDNKMTAQTASMTTQQVSKFWYQHSPWTGPSLAEVEKLVINEVAFLIETTGTAMPGVYQVLNSLTKYNIRIGLATNSPKDLIDTVLNTLGINDFFDATTSADEVDTGKPHPAIYQKALEKLDVNASKAIAIEDSVSGLTAAKAAGMKTLAVPAPDHFSNNIFEIADIKLKSLTEFSLSNLVFE